MAGFENTYLWQSTLAKQLAPDELEKEREFFRVNYENFRVNAGLLAAEISRDLPDYTVHDITHLDALWEIASIICGADYVLNPAEAFVLGGAFLIHDLGMGLAAYPDGIDQLKRTDIWDDTLALLSKGADNKSRDDIEKEATEIVLRSLHAKHAEKLALISWGESDQLYLINNPELRAAYGSVIGIVAHSHWWGANDLTEKLPSTLGAFDNMPNEWSVDPVKLACIMRVSDAAHIDTRRAPLLLNAFRQPNDYAQQHWLFQQKLYQPRLESERLVYTSKSSFSPKEFNSWWLCCDTLNMIDQELRDVDSLLGDTRRTRFKAKGVAGINNLKILSRLITTDGWAPVDTKIHVGNVAKLVKNLGGEQLYGKNLTVPLRELIQNSCDAVRARRIIEGEDSNWGKVTVRAGTDDSGYYIEVEDNGVGMSVDVLSGPFLDFGTSFWGTSMMHEEFPGLESKGFSSTGKYGIGFFSSFMWGEKVCVTTRRFENSRQSTKVLEFIKGLSGRPLLRDAEDDEYIRDGGTRIRVYFSSRDKYAKVFEEDFGDRLDINQVIEDLCPCIDVTIFTEDLNTGKSCMAVEANDWKMLSSERFVQRAVGNRSFKNLSDEDRETLISLSENVRDLLFEDKIIGRGFLSSIEQFDLKRDSVSVEGTVTVGGFRTTGLTKIIGLFLGEAVRASRDIGMPIAAGEQLNKWATEQSELIFAKSSIGEQFEISQYVRVLGGNTKKLIVAQHRSKLINISEFEEIIRDGLKEIVIISTSGLSLIERDNGCKVNLKNNVFVTEVGIPVILQTRAEDNWVSWPTGMTGWFHSSSLEGLLIETFSKAWGVPLESVKEASTFSSDDKSYSYVIGDIEGNEIEYDHADLISLPS